MGYSFLDFMKQIGIFIVCAQSFLHFTAGKPYEKYVKLLIGMIILAQFVAPVRTIFLGKESTELWEEVERFEEELEETAGNIVWEYEEGNAACAALEEEVKEKLEGVAGEYGYDVEKVTVYGDPPEVEVVVGKRKQEEGRIQIEKIEIISGEETGQKLVEPDAGHEEMKSAFGDALQTDEMYIVIIEE